MRVRSFDDFWQLTLFARLFPVNTYLVAHPDGLILIDTGLPLSAAGIAKTIRRLGKPVTDIVLTHAHYDHAGSLDQLTAAFPRARVACSELEAAALAGHATTPHSPGSQAAAPLPGRWIQTKTAPDDALSSGDRIGPLVVVPSPGHTPGHLSYFHEASGTLFTGDALQIRGGLAVAGDRRPTFPWVARATWDAATALDSAKQLADLPIRLLATAHGEALPSPA
ncbi:MAG: MBL fold metallo-hydrolase, partial [Bifidobacteriaceae bacterium]|nr:MBL fold metallo-hydrolase [Bifidobacteriaceae bacterium]